MAKQFHVVGLVINLRVCLCGIFLLQVTDGRRVTCVAVNTSQDISGTFCKCYEVLQTPWSNIPVKPAPYPDRASVKFSNRNGPYPHIQWTQKRYMHDTSYYLEINMYTATLRYNCDINSNQVNTSIYASELTFHFKECCKSILEWLEPGKQLHVSIDARPMYNVDDDAKTIFFSTTIPFPKTTRPSRPAVPKTTRPSRPAVPKTTRPSRPAVPKTTRPSRPAVPKTTRPSRPAVPKTTRPSRPASQGMKQVLVWTRNGYPSDEVNISTSEKTQLIVLISLVIILVCIVVFAAIVLCKRREDKRKKYKEVEVRKILVISDTDQRYIPFVSGFVEIVKKYGKAETEIIANVRKTSEIADNGIIKWTTDNISGANIVVFVVAKAEQIRSNLESEDQSVCLHVALDITESLVLKKGFRAARGKFLAFDLTNSLDSAHFPFCTRYTIKNDVKKLIKHALGVHYNHKTAGWKGDLKMLQKLLPAAENTPNTNTGARKKDSRSFRDTGVNDLACLDNLEARKINNLVQTFEFNNLNHSTLYRRGASVTPSVQNEQYPSIENNENC